jgi:hypothetical protein
MLGSSGVERYDAGTRAPNRHDHSEHWDRLLEGLGIRISERAFGVLAVIDKLNGRGSSPSNREIGDATEIKDQAQVSKLMKQLAHLGLVTNTGAGGLTGKPYAWRVTAKGPSCWASSKRTSDGGHAILPIGGRLNLPTGGHRTLHSSGRSRSWRRARAPRPFAAERCAKRLAIRAHRSTSARTRSKRVT